MSWALSLEAPLSLCVAAATSLLRLPQSTHQAPTRPTLSSIYHANEFIDALVADNILGSSWRRQRRRRSRRRNTKWRRTCSGGHKDSIPGFTSTTLDRMNDRQLNAYKTRHRQLTLKRKRTTHVYMHERPHRVASSIRVGSRSRNPAIRCSSISILGQSSLHQGTILN